MKLTEMTNVIRSKNSGPFMFSLDVFFKNPEMFNKAVASNAFTKENIAELYRMSPNKVLSIIEFEPAYAIKINIKRDVSSGAPLDRDVYGAMQHSPLMRMEIPE